MRSWWLEALRACVAVALLSALATGWSHADFQVADETFVLAAGEDRALPMRVHYHRLVGRLDVAGADPASVHAVVIDAATWHSADGDVSMRQAEHIGRGGVAPVLNYLVRCCDDATYTPYLLVVRNAGSAAATVDLRAWAVHDDFAVVVDRAETGAFGVPFGLFAGLGVLALWRAVRSRRTERRNRGVASKPLGWSIALAVAAGALVCGLGAVGAARYETGIAVGVIAVLADLPLPGGPFGSRSALVMGLLLLAWIGSVGAWIRSVPTGRRGPVATVGALLGGIHVLGGVLLGVAYGSLAVPVILGATLGLPMMTAAWLVSSEPLQP